MTRNKAVAARVVVLALAAVAGYWAYGDYQKRVQQQAVAQLVGDTTARLREALSAPASGDALSRIEANLNAVGAPR